jgi:hypothetical protein
MGEDLPTRFTGPVVCLLPARNASEDLPAWFESVSRFADAVVALDNGSTDNTAELLESHPLVQILLRNPRQPDNRGWSDSLNRNRLLAAAAPLAPSWIICIDADELVPLEDGLALRRFIDERAVAGVAYGFPRYRMIEDHQHFDRLDTKAFRLFAYRPGQAFPDIPLHFQDVPTSIPRCRWLLTDIRVQHLNQLTEERRRERRQKYAEADPDRLWEWGDDYAGTPPGEPKPWPSRRPDQPVMLEAPYPERYAGVDELDLEAPVLSVVLIIGEDTLEEMVAFFTIVQQQACTQLFEILVLALGAEVADDVARSLPRATVVKLAGESDPAKSRNVGLGIAQGDYVVFFERPAGLARGAFDALVDAHDAGRAVVTGAVEQEMRSAASSAASVAGAVHASFAREPLLRLGGFAPRAGARAEGDARNRLLADGHQAGHTPLITFDRARSALSQDGRLRALEWVAGWIGDTSRRIGRGARLDSR